MIRGSRGGVSFSVGARRLALPAGPPPTPRVLVGGLVRFIVAALVVEAALLGLAVIAMPIAGVVVMFLAGVPIGLWVARHLPALRFPAILMMPALAVFSMILIHEPPVGTVASGPPQPFAQAPLVGGYRAHGLRVARELAGERPTGRSGTMTVAPLVAPGWTAAEPVANWVVGTAFRAGRIGPRHPDRWNAPGELVRVIGQDLGQAERAIEDAERRHGLRAAGEAALFTWQPSAAAAMADQAQTLLTVVAIIGGLWALCLGLLAWLSRRRGSAGP